MAVGVVGPGTWYAGCACPCLNSESPAFAPRSQATSSTPPRRSAITRCSGQHPAHALRQRARRRPGSRMCGLMSRRCRRLPLQSMTPCVQTRVAGSPHLRLAGRARKTTQASCARRATAGGSTGRALGAVHGRHSSAHRQGRCATRERSCPRRLHSASRTSGEARGRRLVHC